MFQQTQSNAVNYGNSSLQAGLAPQQPEYGISSAINDLLNVVNSATSNASELRSAFGISVPKAESAQRPSDPSLIGALRDAANALNNANADLIDCLRHLRS